MLEFRQIIAGTLVLGSLLLNSPAAQALLSERAYYSSNYEMARGRFRQAAEEQRQAVPRASVWQFMVPSRRDGDLTVDYLYLPAQKHADRLLVVTSGVHGMEAFAGSAIQLMFMNEFGTSLDHERTGYLIVHSLNPFGFKNYRRATENNVNLNRNFSVSDDLYRTQNTAYSRLRDSLEPQRPVSSPIANLISTAVQLGSRILFGQASLDEFNESIGQGQYESPRGLEYGGERAEPQVADFLGRLKSIAAPYADVILLDLHTGLGESNQLHLMPGDAEGSVDPALFAQLFNPSEDRGIYKYTPNDSAGFYRTHGDLNNVMPEILSRHQRSVALTLEFGTIGSGLLPKLQTLNRLILENEGFHLGYVNQRVESRVRSDFAALFFPEDEHWRENVVTKAREVLKRTLDRMKRLDP